MTTSIVALARGGASTAARLALTFAITVVNRTLVRQPAWHGARRMLPITGTLAWLAMVAFAVAVSMLMGDPQGGHHAIGVWNLQLVLSWVVWVACLSTCQSR